MKALLTALLALAPFLLAGAAQAQAAAAQPAAGVATALGILGILIIGATAVASVGLLVYGVTRSRRHSEEAAEAPAPPPTAAH